MIAAIGPPRLASGGSAIQLGDRGIDAWAGTAPPPGYGSPLLRWKYLPLEAGGSSEGWAWALGHDDFPLRITSALKGQAVDALEPIHQLRLIREAVGPSRDALAGVVFRAAARLRPPPHCERAICKCPRSEEHTSELQSPC